VKEPRILFGWISSGGSFASRLPTGADADAALDARDGVSTERALCEIDQAVRARLALATPSDEDHQWVGKAAELAFRLAFDASLGHHDLAAQVSDDVRLLAEASLVGYRSPVLERMWTIYAAGAFPVALREPTGPDGEWTST
jgi:hypothetical protein